ncbi:MAG: tetratricopeptide repeat protein [Bacillota bacterium]
MILSIASFLITNTFALQVTTDFKTLYQKPGDSNLMELNPRDVLQLDPGQQVLFQADGHIPMLIVVPKDKDAQVHLSNDQQKDLIQKATQKPVSEAVSEIVSKIQATEWLIRSKNYSGAQMNLTELQNKYPQVASIYFMQGTVHFLLNNRKAAVTAIEQGLQIDPNNIDAKKLLENLRKGQ